MLELTRDVDGTWRIDQFDHPQGMHWISRLNNEDMEKLVEIYLRKRYT